MHIESKTSISHSFIASFFFQSLHSKDRIIVRFPWLANSCSEMSSPPKAGKFMVDSHHCNACAGVRFADDFTPVWIVHRFWSTVGKIRVKVHIQDHNKFNSLLDEFESNSLITASYSKRLHADTLETVTGYPALSYPIHLSQVFTAPWKCKIFFIVVMPSLDNKLVPSFITALYGSRDIP